jgi:hypothetical protein
LTPSLRAYRIIFGDYNIQRTALRRFYGRMAAKQLLHLQFRRRNVSTISKCNKLRFDADTFWEQGKNFEINKKAVTLP